jgi:hypothetical protein
MALEGTLKDVGLSDILQLLSMQKKTGVLTVSRGKDLVTVCFEKGEVVFADEFQRSEQERLGAILLKSKLLTPQQLLKAAEIQKQTLQKLGFILVNDGFINHEQLKEALQTQIKETVFKLFRWEDGDFKFTQEAVAYDPSIYTPLHTDFLVMEGIRRIDEWPIIKKKISGPDMVFGREEGAEERIGVSGDRVEEEDLDNILSFVEDGSSGLPPTGEGSGVKLSSAERIVFSLLDGHRTVEDLANETRLGEFETSKALFSLLSMGIIKGVTKEKISEEETKVKRWDRSLVKRLAVLGILALFILFLALFNPLGLTRTGPQGVDALDSVGRAEDNSKLERIRFALLCYYLETQTYPPALGSLVEARFLKEEDIRDHVGNQFFYLRESDGYSLKSSSGLGKGKRG